MYHLLGYGKIASGKITAGKTPNIKKRRDWFFRSKEYNASAFGSSEQNRYPEIGKSLYISRGTVLVERDLIDSFVLKDTINMFFRL